MGNKSKYVKYKTLQYGKYSYGVPSVNKLKDYNLIIIDKEKDKDIDHTGYLFFKPETINKMNLDKDTLKYMSEHLGELSKGESISGDGNVALVDIIDQYGGTIGGAFESDQSEILVENIQEALNKNKLTCIETSKIKETYKSVPEFKEVLLK